MTNLNPGETEAEALKRQIKMHEFLMDGGIAEGRDKGGNILYSDPITVTSLPDECPFHSGTDCPAWAEIVAGRGQWTKLELELAQAETEFDALITKEGTFTHEDSARTNELKFLILDLEEKLAGRPRTVRDLREQKVYAPAPNKHKPGNPWDRDKAPAPAKQIATWKNGLPYDAEGNLIPQSAYGSSSYTPPQPKVARDTRDVVDAAASALSESADKIEFEEGEDDEDE